MAETVLIILALATLGWVLLNRFLYTDALSAANIFYFAWVGPLILQTADLSRLETPWSPSSEIAVLVVTVGMAFICLAPPLVSRRRYSGPLRLSTTAIRDLQDLRFLIPLLGIWAATMGAYVYSEFVTNPSGIPLITLLRNPLEAYSDAHRWGKETQWSIITASLWLWTPLLYAAARVHRSAPARRYLLFAALIYPAFSVLKLSRSDLFVSVFTIAIVYMATVSEAPPTHKRRLPLLAIAFSAAATLMVALAVIRSSAGTTLTYNDFIQFKGKGRDPLTLTGGQLYGYFALPFENLHQQMESGPGGQGFGSGVFRPFLSLFGQGQLADKLEEQAGLRSVSPAAGSSTFLSLIYGDLGHEGVIVVPLLYAVFVTGIYAAFRRDGSLPRLALWLNFAYPWAWLYFNNGFARLNIYLTPAYFLLLYAAYLLWRRSSETQPLRAQLQTDPINT